MVRQKNTEKKCVTIPRDLLDDIQRSYPGLELSPILTQLLMYAHAAGFMRRLSTITPEPGSKHGDIPVLMANSAQLEYAEHAHRYLCRVLESTADEEARQYLKARRTDVSKKAMSINTYDRFIDYAKELGWKGDSQDAAPIPKEGTARRRPGRVAAVPMEVFGQETEVEEFGA